MSETRSSLERQIAACRTHMERTEKSLAYAEQELAGLQAKLAALPPEREDDFEPYSFLVVERDGLAPRYFHKDAGGAWWYSAQISSPVGWDVVRQIAFEGDDGESWGRRTRVVSTVTHMQVIS